MRLPRQVKTFVSGAEKGKVSEKEVTARVRLLTREFERNGLCCGGGRDLDLVFAQQHERVVARDST